MRNQLLPFFLFQISYASSYVNADNFEISYSITNENSCQTEKDRFQFILGSSIEHCVKECSVRQHCQALNFRGGINGCELFSSSESGQLSKGNCRHVDRHDINVIQTPCQNDCKYGEVCETSDSGKGRCIIKECINGTVPEHVEILGNHKEVGRKIRYQCDKGYSGTNGTRATVAECLNTGDWSTNTKCLKVNYTWAMWTDWTSCSLSCGGGMRNRTRTCSIHSESLGEAQCQEDDNGDEEELCNEHNCPTPTIGNVCTSDADCTETEGTCIEGFCFCNRLYRYNTTSKNCTKVCQSMSNEFTTINRKRIIDFNSGAPDSIGKTIEDCEIACSGNTECLSFESWPVGANVRCTTGSVTVEMIEDAYPEMLTGANPGANLHTRQCN